MVSKYWAAHQQSCLSTVMRWGLTIIIPLWRMSLDYKCVFLFPVHFSVSCSVLMKSQTKRTLNRNHEVWQVSRINQVFSEYVGMCLCWNATLPRYDRLLQTLSSFHYTGQKTTVSVQPVQHFTDFNISRKEILQLRAPFGHSVKYCKSGWFI